jgi:HPt (histidine-containing phosphotransfer) domain-containing protein
MNFLHIESEKVLNTNVLCQLVEDIGFERVNVVTEMSIQDLKKLFCDVSNAGQNSDWAALKVASHSLLGVCSIVGADKLRGLSQELEFNCEDRRYFMASVLVADILLGIMKYIQTLDGFRKLESQAAVYDRCEIYLNSSCGGSEFGQLSSPTIAI